MDDMDDYKNDEIINVKLPRSQYELLRKMIKEREAKNWLGSKMHSWWILGIGSSALIIWEIYDKIRQIVEVKT